MLAHWDEILKSHESSGNPGKAADLFCWVLNTFNRNISVTTTVSENLKRKTFRKLISTHGNMNLAMQHSSFSLTKEAIMNLLLHPFFQDMLSPSVCYDYLINCLSLTYPREVSRTNTPSLKSLLQVAPSSLCWQRKAKFLAVIHPHPAIPPWVSEWVSTHRSAPKGLE